MLYSKLVSFFQSSSNDSSVVPDETNKVVLESVNFGFDKSDILQDISLSLNEYRIGIIGNNGSGKSTLIRLLNGLNQPTQGYVNVFGLDTQLHQKHLPRLVGFIFQNPDHQIIFPTVLEELAFGLEQLGSTSEVAQQGARAFLKKHSVESLAEKPIQNLSEGQKQLVCILAVLIMKPRLLLLDEPFSSLDLVKRKSLLKLLNTHCERLIMVSHDLEVLSGFDRVLWLDEGRVRADGQPDDVIQRYRAFVDGLENDIPVKDL